MESYSDKYKLWDEFLDEWPLSRLSEMTLDEYIKTGSQDTFTYWIESRLGKLGSIWGGSAFKFGVFSRESSEPKVNDKKHSYTDTHGWYTALGDSAEETFEKVRESVVRVAQLARCQWPLLLIHFRPLKLTHLRSGFIHFLLQSIAFTSKHKYV